MDNRFTPPVEFVAPFAGAYGSTLEAIGQGLDRYPGVYVEGTQRRKGQEALKDIRRDMERARRTALNYYEKGGKWDGAYCVLSRITGHTLSFESSVPGPDEDPPGTNRHILDRAIAELHDLMGEELSGEEINLLYERAVGRRSFASIAQGRGVTPEAVRKQYRRIESLIKERLSPLFP